MSCYLLSLLTVFAFKEARLEQQLLRVDNQAHTVTGQQFNLSSPDQVSKLLYDVLKLQPSSSSNAEGTAGSGGKKRHASTAEEELQRLVETHPVVPLILQHRSLNKLLTTYLYGLKPFLVSSKETSGASVHATWNQTSVRTGRLSCSQPNLQNIPNKQVVGSEEYDVRSLFIARDGFVLVGE